MGEEENYELNFSGSPTLIIGKLYKLKVIRDYKSVFDDGINIEDTANLTRSIQFSPLTLAPYIYFKF